MTPCGIIMHIMQFLTFFFSCETTASLKLHPATSNTVDGRNPAPGSR